MEIDYTPHPSVIGLAGLVDRLARAIGPDCEIVLHDLGHPHNSLVHIAGSLTNRVPGAPITNIVLEALRDWGDQVPDLFNYRSQAPNGHALRSSTLFIRDEDRVVGALCVNLDVTAYEEVARLTDRALSYEERDPEPAERFGNTVADVLDDLLAAVFRETGVRPGRMSSEERLSVVAGLEERGVFLIKGAVELVARRLSVSKFTVYSYLQQIRADRTLQPADQDDDVAAPERAI